MSNIGIVGAGVAGLNLGLFLRQHDIPVTIYTERTPVQQFGSRLPALVARAGHTRERERKLGVNFWDNGNNEFALVNFHVPGDQPLAFQGHLAQSMIAVDMRIYFGRLLEEFAARGGRVVVGELQVGDVSRLSVEHDLLVVSTGRAGLTDLFPRIDEHSPFTQPQRLITTGIFRGVSHTNPISASFTLVPEQGEIFEFPIYSFEPNVTGLGFEAIPGGVFEPLVGMRYEDDPAHFNATILNLLRTYAPAVAERIDPDRFGLTRPLDLLQGGVTPTVRRGYAQLGNGKYALALGDVHVVNDPITGQGANKASYTAWMLGEAIRDGATFDEAFCKRMDERIWAYTGPITTWSNIMLQPPQPHLFDLIVAAAQHQPIADAFARFFEQPLNSEVMFTPERTAAFLQEHGWQGMPEVEMAT